MDLMANFGSRCCDDKYFGRLYPDVPISGMLPELQLRARQRMIQFNMLSTSAMLENKEVHQTF
eukprot:2027526-Amphidinium_carterae.1